MQRRLHIHNRGDAEVPGVLVWELRDDAGDKAEQLDASFAGILCALNATPQQISVAVPDKAWELHPALAADVAAHVAHGMLSLPPYTAAAFVVKRRA